MIIFSHRFKDKGFEGIEGRQKPSSHPNWHFHGTFDKKLMTLGFSHYPRTIQHFRLLLSPWILTLNSKLIQRFLLIFSLVPVFIFFQFVFYYNLFFVHKLFFYNVQLIFISIFNLYYIYNLAAYCYNKAYVVTTTTTTTTKSINRIYSTIMYYNT